VEWQFDSAELIRLREELGLDQTELADRCGLSVRGLQLFEHGLQSPSAISLTKLTRGLNCRPGQLFKAVEL
jgi:transcriptional regulator with XRE-family HTH domain